MIVLKILLIALIIITSLFLVLTILMHKGRGGGLSDMFGGGITQTAQSSGVAERNLNRITIVSLVIWVACIVLYALSMRFGWLESSDAQSDSDSSESGQSGVVVVDETDSLEEGDAVEVVGDSDSNSTEDTDATSEE